MQIQGRPLAEWVAEVNTGAYPSDPAMDVLASTGPSVLNDLAGILEHDASPDQQGRAAYAISVIAYRNPDDPQVPKVLPALISGAESHDPQVRLYAVQALATLGKHASNAIPVLIRATKDDDHGVRLCAVDALARIGIVTPQTVMAFKNSMSDPSGDVQALAVLALYKIGQPATNALSTLISLTTNEDVGTRCLAVETLGHVATNSPEAVVALKQALNDQSTTFVRPLARKALQELEVEGY